MKCAHGKAMEEDCHKCKSFYKEPNDVGIDSKTLGTKHIGQDVIIDPAAIEARFAAIESDLKRVLAYLHMNRGEVMDKPDIIEEDFHPDF